MSLFGWALTFVGLGVLALGALALLTLRLWRAGKALGRDLASASSQLAELGSVNYPPEVP
jgi:predicted MFS family arabinose efflux permease